VAIKLPTWDGQLGRLVEVTYYDAREVAAMLGYSPRTVTRYTSELGLWPHVRLNRQPYLTEEMIGRVVELLTYDPASGEPRPLLDDPPQQRPPRLGRVLSEEEIEAIE
jgi:hypothetical protein